MYLEKDIVVLEPDLSRVFVACLPKLVVVDARAVELALEHLLLDAGDARQQELAVARNRLLLFGLLLLMLGSLRGRVGALLRRALGPRIGAISAGLGPARSCFHRLPGKLLLHSRGLNPARSRRLHGTLLPDCRQKRVVHGGRNHGGRGFGNLLDTGSHTRNSQLGTA